MDIGTGNCVGQGRSQTRRSRPSVYLRLRRICPNLVQSCSNEYLQAIPESRVHQVPAQLFRFAHASSPSPKHLAAILDNVLCSVKHSNLGEMHPHEEQVRRRPLSSISCASPSEYRAWGILGLARQLSGSRSSRRPPEDGKTLRQSWYPLLGSPSSLRLYYAMHHFW
jgi:hypothetical protein